MDFRWNEWNIEHVQKHGVFPEEAEDAVRLARLPYPEAREDGKRLAIGPGVGGRLLQVVYLVGDDDCVYVIHARPLTDVEKHRYRRRMR